MPRPLTVDSAPRSNIVKNDFDLLIRAASTKLTLPGNAGASTLHIEMLKLPLDLGQNWNRIVVNRRVAKT